MAIIDAIPMQKRNKTAMAMSFDLTRHLLMKKETNNRFEYQ